MGVAQSLSLLVCPYLQLHGIQINTGVNIKFVMDICSTL
jgi:hypothetical protein